MGGSSVRSMGFSPENKGNQSSVDIFRLQTGEKARIVVLDQSATMGWAHYLTVGERGRSIVCLGDEHVLASVGSDSGSCPACALAEPGRDSAVGYPRRRFAIRIARYRTNKSGEVLKPISLALEAWAFGDDKFNKLVDRATEHGDLRKKDLIVTSVSGMWQSMDIEVGAKVAFQDDQSALSQYKTIRERAAEVDLERVIGTKMSFEALESLVRRIKEGAGGTVPAKPVPSRNGQTFGSQSSNSKTIDDILSSHTPSFASKSSNSFVDDDKEMELDAIL